MAQQRGSARLRSAAGSVSKLVNPRIIARRTRHRIDRLNKINFHEDPNPNLDNFVMVDDEEAGFKKKKRPRHTKKRQRRMLAAVREDQKIFMAPKGSKDQNADVALPRAARVESLTSYEDQTAAPSRYPRKYFCAVSGFPARYTNIVDGERHDSRGTLVSYLAAQKG